MLGGAAALAFVTRDKWMPPTPVAEVPATPIAVAAPPPVAPPAPAPVESATAPPAKAIAKVTIQPATATVQVDGKPSGLVDGVLSLEGEPGDTRTVVAVSGAARVETRVTILKGGIADPSTINIVVPKRAGAPARAPAAAPPPKPAPAAAAPAAATPAPAAPKPAGPNFQKDW
jgi:hypothetical protein